MERAETLLMGLLLLLLILPGVLAELPGVFRGGYGPAFFKLPLDQKLEHIVRQPGYWMRIGILWMPTHVLAVMGMGGFSYQLASRGAGMLSFAALSAFVFGSVAWALGVLGQVHFGRRAAQARATDGETPGWLHPVWAMAWWTEIVYLGATNVAFIGWGVGILHTGYPARWLGWTAIALGGGALAMLGLFKDAPPQLGVLVPIITGVALVLHSLS